MPNSYKLLCIASSIKTLFFFTFALLSNFMLWQHAYTELYFTDCLWPDFNEDELDLGIKHYLRTTRKFGAIEEYDKISEEDA